MQRTVLILSAMFGMTSVSCRSAERRDHLDEISKQQEAQLSPEKPLTALPYAPSLDTSSIDRTVTPCEDFYQFSCGGWMAKNPIPADKSSWSVYGKLAHDTNRYLWGILDQLATNAAKLSGDQAKLGQYFASCMNEDHIEKLGSKPLASDWRAIAELKTKEDLPALLAAMHKASADDGLFFGFHSTPDFANASRIIAGADAGGLGLPDRDYYLSKEPASLAIMNAYQSHVTRTFTLMGYSEAEAKQAADKVITIERALARARLTQVERRDSRNLDHPMNLKRLQKLTPSFSWAKYFAALGVPTPRVINVGEPAFFKELEKQWHNLELKDLKAYLAWNLVRDRSPYLSSAFVNEHFDFYDRTLHGVPKLPPRWQRCVALTDMQLGEALGKEFVTRNFSPRLKDQTLRMSKQVEDAMRDRINNLTWMSAPTKRQALAKLTSLADKVGYPDRWRDYSKFSVHPDDFFGNVQRGYQFESEWRLAKIGRALDRQEWSMTPQTVNAYYDPQMNDMNFPAAVLQPPLYDAKLDAAPNYGNTGSTIGHELTHAFDDSGRQFDSKGNLRDWWKPTDGKEFNRRAQCIVDQYATYTIVDNVKINSKLTLGEDVADLGGTILAYLAWREELKAEPSDSTDGFTPAQRFFIGFAQWACENNRPENLRVNALTNPHSPGKYRINGVVVNLPEFKEAFACKEGQAMVKKAPCQVW